MKVTLQITYDVQLDICQVAGIPMLQNQETGEQKPLKGVCFAALEHARQVIATFDPSRKESPGILVAGGALPGRMGG